MSTKAILIISMATIAVFLAISAADAENAINSVNGNALLANPAIVKDEIMIPMVNGTVMEWRHIILKGNNTQIGIALGEIAQKDYGLTTLKKYADPVYGKARQEYMARNYPIMSERMKGVAVAFGISPDNGTFDTAVLPYDTDLHACSMVYFPPTITTNGHAYSVKS